jgi:tetratricopeptide (TPR) repeat protein
MLLYTEGDMLPALRRVSTLLQSVEGPDKRLRAELFALAGDVYQNLRDYENAERAYAQAIDIKRSHPEFRRKAGLAALYRALQLESEELARQSLEHFESALLIDADYVHAIYGRGMARFEVARLGGENELLDGAIQDFSRVVEQAVRYRDQALAQRALARATLAERRGSRELIESALEDMSDVAEHVHTAAMWMTYASLYVIASRLYVEDPLPRIDKALELLRKATGSAPRAWLTLGDTLYLRAQVKESVEDYQQALEAYRKELELVPESSDARFNMSQVHFALAYHYLALDAAASERQIKLAIEAIGRCPESSEVRFERGKMRHLLGTLLKGDPAREQFGLSLADLANLPKTHAGGHLERGKVFMARAQLAEGSLDRVDLAEARKEIKAAVALDPSLAATANPLLGWLKSFLGEDR